MSSSQSRSSTTTVTDVETTPSELKLKEESKENADTTDDSIEEQPTCLTCQEKAEYIQELQSALRETIGQNEDLKSRVVELEAWINEKGDELDNHDKVILELKRQIKDARLKVSNKNLSD